MDRMIYRIGLEKQNKPNDQIIELVLDNCQYNGTLNAVTGGEPGGPPSGSAADELVKFVNLETLSLNNIGLITLKGFPKLPKLKKLELSDNRLTGGLYLLHESPKLQHLNLSGNRIKDLDALEPLKEFHDLVTLDLYNCDVTKSENYRQKVFELLPNLHSLDGYDQNEREVADSDDSEDEGSDIENRITRDDNEDEEDAEDEDDDAEDDLDDEDGVDEEDVVGGDESGSDDVELERGENGNDYDNFDDEDELDDEEDDDEDDDDDDDDDEDDQDDDDEAGDGRVEYEQVDSNAEADEYPDEFSEDEKAERRAFEAVEPDSDSNKVRGQKRKHEDEGGDEVADE